MANKTTNYNLTKPLPEDFYDINVHNANMDIIDAELKKRASLDETGKVPSNQIPDLDYIKTEQLNVAGGVAGLDETGKLKGDIFPEGVGGGGKRTARFTVGSSQYGWTASDCDYLCDGTADEVEINAAIQALRSTGGEVVLLDGLYHLNSAILINKDNVTLIGNGANTKIIRAFNDDEYADKQGMVVITNSFCTIKNLYFDCVKGSYTSNTAIGIYGDNCIIADNTIVNSSCDGIYVEGNYHTIDNNIITGCNGNGLYLYSGNKYTVTNNKITGSTVYGMYLYNVKDSAISNNVCTENTDCGIKVYWCDRCTFTGNVLNNNNQCGLYLTRGEGNVISGNTFVGNGYYGIYLNSYSADTIVMSNAFLNNTSGEIRDGGSNNTLYLPSHTHNHTDINGLGGEVVLAKGTIANGATSATIDLSGVDMSQFKELRLCVDNVTNQTFAKGSYRWIAIRFNGDATAGHYHSANNNVSAGNTAAYTAIFSNNSNSSGTSVVFGGQYRMTPMDFAGYTIVDTLVAFGQEIGKTTGTYRTLRDGASTNYESYNRWNNGSLKDINSITILLMGWGSSSSVHEVFPVGRNAPFVLYGIKA